MLTQRVLATEEEINRHSKSKAHQKLASAADSSACFVHSMAQIAEAATLRRKATCLSRRLSQLAEENCR